jgi:hypothetical protein
MSIFDHDIEMEKQGMAGGIEWFSVEDLYQAFKDRIQEEEKIKKETE